MTIDGLFKKAVGKIHKPTMISALRDDIREHHQIIEHYQSLIRLHGFEIQKLEVRLGDLLK